MSQERPRRAQLNQAEAYAHVQGEPIKYGDVFNVQGELAREPIAPRDAAMMQAAENLVMGQTQKGGPAAVMQSAAKRNERAGLVGHRDVSGLPADQGVSVTETDLPGRRVVAESVGGQMVGRYETPAPVSMATPEGALRGDAITIGEALGATAMTAGGKPVDESDAAALQAAEVRATGRNEVLPGGVAAEAQSAADANARVMRDEDKVKLTDVVTDATTKLPADKAVTREDADRVVGAEMRNSPDMATHPQGVAANVAAAARLNQNRQS
ncbi:late embryogenesis abundant protein D-34-like [Phoenix dactylifera]|uniref:Late embryogenesis abundant protein D-34-like n=1 Tax=Phoenix dactylifera TaxID=42345 RepID=A0A8B7D1H0_PHODC|nr:late embryogenesis abundant protein D-34-like [Phoenix dactylifera]